MSGAKDWTAAMTAFLVRMRRRGKPYWWIAKALGVTRQVLLGRAVKMGLVVRAPGKRVNVAALADEPAPLGPARTILEHGVCHWISGDTADADWRMCGHGAVEGGSWCAHHRARVFAYVSESKRCGPEPRDREARSPVSWVPDSKARTPNAAHSGSPSFRDDRGGAER